MLAQERALVRMHRFLGAQYATHLFLMLLTVAVDGGAKASTPPPDLNAVPQDAIISAVDWQILVPSDVSGLSHGRWSGRDWSWPMVLLESGTARSEQGRLQLGIQFLPDLRDPFIPKLAKQRRWKIVLKD